MCSEQILSEDNFAKKIERVCKKIAKEIKTLTFFDQQHNEKTVGDLYIKNCLRNWFLKDFIHDNVRTAILNKRGTCKLLRRFLDRRDSLLNKQLKIGVRFQNLQKFISDWNCEKMRENKPHLRLKLVHLIPRIGTNCVEKFCIPIPLVALYESLFDYNR